MLVVAAAVLAILGWTTLTQRLFDGDNAMTTMSSPASSPTACPISSGACSAVRAGSRATASASWSIPSRGSQWPRHSSWSRPSSTAATAVVAAGVAGAIVPLLVGRKHLRGLETPGRAHPSSSSSACRSRARRVSWRAPTSSSSTAARSSSSPPAGRAPRAGRDRLRRHDAGACSRLRVPGARSGAAPEPHPFAGDCRRCALPPCSSAHRRVPARLRRIDRCRHGARRPGGHEHLVRIRLQRRPDRPRDPRARRRVLPRRLHDLAGAARGRSANAAAKAWAVSAAAFVALYFAIPGGSLMRVSGAFTCATLVCLTLLGVALSGKMRS